MRRRPDGAHQPLCRIRRYSVMRTLVIVPTHNEAENIGALLDALNFHVGDADVLVIDDASNDDTRSIV
ncbi:MAG: glycosyltransferase [Ilumatobacter sp.]|nr:glycosyltransferase [Ilumatobacter sp.]